MYFKYFQNEIKNLAKTEYSDIIVSWFSAVAHQGGHLKSAHN